MKPLLKHAIPGILLALAIGIPAFAQPSTDTQFTLTGLTREGTVITNVATASFTDANNNTYANVNAQVSVTVGFLANLDIAAPPTQTPVGPSQDNSLPITITNNGNGDDTFALSTTIPEGITNVRYVFDGVTYTDLASLNAALAAAGIAADEIINIEILYDVLDGYGGQALDLAMTVTSTKDPTQAGSSDTASTIITPVLVEGVAVTPDDGLQERLPSNGTQYTAVFDVISGSNITETFNLLAALSGGDVTIVSVNGTSGSSSTVVVGPNGTVQVTVVYTVADVAAGSETDLTLSATAQSNGSITDSGLYTIRVVRPALSMTKEAFRDDRTVLINGGQVLPGEYIQYKITVLNDGTFAADQVQISDTLPVELNYDSAEGDTPTWSIGIASGVVTANLTESLAPSGSRYIWIRAQVK